MKKRSKKSNDMLPEYDFATMKAGVRGKYAESYRAGTNLVLLDPEVYKAGGATVKRSPSRDSARL